ncbi:transporter [Microbulbifer magnicolonia]|uniref:transporter n=1 Tax=Microbulbifer magnicolonia TaxID=3109744 RepID=UPI002B40D3FB|nr:hypothetical protein [Microbulbifer sp. GG15]
MASVRHHTRHAAALCLLLSLSGAAQAAPITFNTALPVAEGEFVWREQLVRRRRSDGGPLDREVSVDALGSVLGYGANSRLAVFAALPYFFDRELRVTTPAGRLQRDTGGIGDLALFARYTLYKRDSKGATFRIAPLLGLEAPTGDDRDRDAVGRLPRPLQAGSGGWDVFGGVVVTWQTLQYQIDSQLLFRENGRHDGFDPGDQWRFDASLQYRAWPRELTGDTPAFLYLVLESNLSHTGRDIDDERGIGLDPNSGGTQWLLAPGLQYVTQRWILEGAVQLPAASNPHGNALEDDYLVRAGFRYNF